VRRRRAVWLGLVLVAALAGAARAQNPAVRIARGIAAFQNLEYDSAAAMLAGGLADSAAAALPDSTRVRGLVYLGATDVFRNKRDSATAVFTRLLSIDPRYRINQLIFPPEVTNLFEEVRLTTPSVLVVVPDSSILTALGDRVVIWLYAASYHPIVVRVLGPDGAVLRTLYDGGLSDSLQLLWEARGSNGLLVDGGHYSLRVDSRGQDGRVARSVVLPLELVRLVGDTLPLPPALPTSAFKPEHTPGGTGLRSLALGLGTALAVAVLPSVVAGRSGASDRFLVAATLGAVGAAAVPLQRHSQPIPANIAANEALRLEWRQRTDSVRAINAAIERRAPLLVRPGSPHVLARP
jgi:hypothetical protein